MHLQQACHHAHVTAELVEMGIQKCIHGQWMLIVWIWQTLASQAHKLTRRFSL